MKIKSFKLVLFFASIVLFAATVYYYIKADIPLIQYPRHIRQYILGFGIYAPLIYIVIYILRPLVFFPTTLLTAASGAVFGPVQGIICTGIGKNLSANFSFLGGPLLWQKYFQEYGFKVMDRHPTVKCY